MSESQSITNSLPRTLERRGARVGVAFDPSAGPAEPESAKVRHIIDLEK